MYGGGLMPPSCPRLRGVSSPGCGGGGDVGGGGWSHRCRYISRSNARALDALGILCTASLVGRGARTLPRLSRGGTWLGGGGGGTAGVGPHSWVVPPPPPVPVATLSHGLALLRLVAALSSRLQLVWWRQPRSRRFWLVQLGRFGGVQLGFYHPAGVWRLRGHSHRHLHHIHIWGHLLLLGCLLLACQTCWLHPRH